MGEFLKRGGWLFLAILFVVTALGVGVYAFVLNTHSSGQNSSYTNCPTKRVGQQKPGSDGKYQGTKLVDFTPVKRVDYLQCWDLKVGTGAVVNPNSTITATYTGALAANGKIFQSSLDNGQPFTTQLTQVIPGWTSGLPGMRAGGTRRLLIPAQYAYGSQALPGIPANSDLVFDVTVISVK